MACLVLVAAFVPAALAANDPEVTPIWHNECVDCPVSHFQVGDRSLSLDGDGQPRVAYAGDHLYYAWFDGVAWHVETVDEAPGIDDVYPSPPSLALDAAGNPHISYLNATTTALRHAFRTAQGWQTETVDAVPAGLVFDYDTALALDGAGNPHIAYPKNGELHYAFKSGGSWAVQLVDPTQKAEFHVSLALDDTGQPHISYGVWRGAAGLYLKYARRVSGAWAHEVVEDGFLGEYNAIAVNSQGVPSISYLDYAHGKLKLAERTTSGWLIQVVDDLRWFGGFTSLALDGVGHPHISYAGPPSGLRYARWTGTAWEIENLAGNVWFTSLALDQAGQAHLVYHDWTARGLGYAVRVAGSWLKETVDRTADAGAYSSLAATDDDLWIAYYERGNGDLRIARRSGDLWSVQTADAAGDVGAHASLALDAAGAPHVSYYEAIHGNLKFANRVGDQWVRQAVDTEGDVGRHTALALDAQDNPTISYYDATQGDLKLATRFDGQWVLETVDGAGDVGASTSLALDEQGRPVIAYYDATNGDLKLAARHAGLWSQETVDEVGDVGSNPALALDPLGEPCISYYDATGRALKLACRTNGGWAIETVDDRDDAGRQSSLLVDEQGVRHLVYTIGVDGGLRYARSAKGPWTIRTVVEGWRAGQYPSLVRDGRSRLLVSFYDGSQEALRLATGSPFGAYLPRIGTR